MNGYLPTTGDTVTLGDCAGIYTILKMQDYYDHDPLNSEVLVLRPDGETIGWDLLGNITLVGYQANVRRATEVLVQNAQREVFRNMDM